MGENIQVGSVIYVPYAGQTEVSRPCRVCNGDKRVTLILGSGEQVRLDCEFCGRGINPPTGCETAYEFAGRVQSYTVDAIETVHNASGTSVRYRCGSANAYTSIDGDKAFATSQAAMARADEMLAEAAAEQEARMRQKEKGNASYAWNAGYHLREAKRAREQAAYHERKAALMREQARPSPQSSTHGREDNG